MGHSEAPVIQVGKVISNEHCTEFPTIEPTELIASVRTITESKCFASTNQFSPRFFERKGQQPANKYANHDNCEYEFETDPVDQRSEKRRC